MSIPIEITWKNLLGFAMAYVGIKSLFIAFTTGNLDTGWLLSANMKKSKFDFVWKVGMTIIYTLIAGYTAFGFINTKDDYNILSFFFK